jgi:hypothetical protein
MNTTTDSTKSCVIALWICFASFALVSSVWAQPKREEPSVTFPFQSTTQGPLWPPSEIANEEGDFILVGQVLTETAPGQIVPLPTQAALVSKATVPPLDKNGREDFSNPLGAPYKVIRPLDLSPGSKDLKMVLHTLSFGPFEGAFGGGPRIPREGESPYNLNGTQPPCLELFPSTSQRLTYTRPSFPFHKAPIWGFQGDQLAYDVDTGEPYDPHTGSGSSCPPEGCPGENIIDTRRTKPITLGEWLRARGEIKITLTRFNEEVGAYTAAHFNFRFRDLPPHAVFTILAIRRNVVEPLPKVRPPNPLGIPNVLISDAQGRAKFSAVVPNPFPDPMTDDKGLRVIALVVDYHSDYMSKGACPTRLGAGVDGHPILSTAADGTRDITQFITKEAP